MKSSTTCMSFSSVCLFGWYFYACNSQSAKTHVFNVCLCIFACVRVWKYLLCRVQIREALSNMTTNTWYQDFIRVAHQRWPVIMLSVLSVCLSVCVRLPVNSLALSSWSRNSIVSSHPYAWLSLGARRYVIRRACWCTFLCVHVS